MENVLHIDLTTHWVGIATLVAFCLAYLLVMLEERTHLRKSKPVMLAAGLIWAMIAFVYARAGDDHVVELAVRQTVLEFAELFLFLLAAMTYVNAMSERGVFAALRSWLVRMHLSYRQLFWITGFLAFFLSPVIDNLTTALVLCFVVLSVGGDEDGFVGLSCINIVVAANAGGAFSPFGDITTLLIWQRGHVQFQEFFALFLPSVVNFLVPAVCMYPLLPRARPASTGDQAQMKRGGTVVVGLFIATLITAVCFHTFLHLPPFLGMMTGLSYLSFFGFYLQRTHHKELSAQPAGQVGDVTAFDVFRSVARAEWDTMLFFFGVIMCVGGIGFIGYLKLVSAAAYTGIGPTGANILVGLLSAVVDNIPVVVAVLRMEPEMGTDQWLLLALTAGVGGSLLSIGSAAGVALMGQARGKYTFLGHLRFTPVIALGYAASIAVYLAMR